MCVPVDTWGASAPQAHPCSVLHPRCVRTHQSKPRAIHVLLAATSEERVILCLHLLNEFWVGLRKTILHVPHD